MANKQKKYSKQQWIEKKVQPYNVDILQVALTDGERYTPAEVDRLVTAYRNKKEVK